MPFDKAKAAAAITKPGFVLPKYGKGLCATHVRVAFEAGGLDTTGHPVGAKDYGPTLLKMGFAPVSAVPGYVPQLGDVIVIPGIQGHFNGHIELYDGKNWVSDFVQDNMWPARAYEAAKPAYKIYRYR